jgi:SAM-dependent methyltransferase
MTQKTDTKTYTQRLYHHESAWWKKALDVQAPYRWNLSRLNPGFMLDVGCGLGRNLISNGGKGVGVDHNPHSVAEARRRGLRAFTTEEFLASEFARGETFDSLLLAHVVEHMPRQQALDILRAYLPFLKNDGRLILITPQEAGYNSDPTHVEFVDHAGLESLVADSGLRLERSLSFPFPRWVGRWFKYNECVVTAIKGKKAGS